MWPYSSIQHKKNPQVDTPWFYQALFISASDHNTLWGSLWEIQMSSWLKINRGSAETWVCLNRISPTYILYPRRLVINPIGTELHSHAHHETWVALHNHWGTSTHQNIHKHGEYSPFLPLPFPVFILKLCLWTALWLYSITSRGMSWGLVWRARKQRGACVWL